MFQIKTWIENNKILAGCSLFFMLIVILAIIIIRPDDTQGRNIDESLDENTFQNIGEKVQEKTGNEKLKLQQSSSNNETYMKQEESTINEEEKTKQITVDIKGAVRNEGIYKATNKNRVYDIVSIAEPLKLADLDQVNLALPLYDSMVIYIPFKGEVDDNKYEKYNALMQQPTGENNEQKEKININKDDQTRLEEIPGIGPKKAVEIINYRETNGGFKSIEEIKEIKGIGEKTYESLKDYIEI